MFSRRSEVSSCARTVGAVEEPDPFANGQLDHGLGIRFAHEAEMGTTQTEHGDLLSGSAQCASRQQSAQRVYCRGITRRHNTHLCIGLSHSACPRRRSRLTISFSLLRRNNLPPANVGGVQHCPLKT